MTEQDPSKSPEPPPVETPAEDGGEQLLDTGQEEVFSRAEVELGKIEHGSAAGRHGAAPGGTHRITQGHPTYDEPGRDKGGRSNGA